MPKLSKLWKCWKHVDHRAKNQGCYEATKTPRSIEVGYSYPGCTAEELIELNHAHEIADRLVDKTKLIRVAEEIGELEHWLAKPPSDRAKVAIGNLRRVWTENDKKHPWSPDVAIKCWNDVDRSYFERRLEARVRLRWLGSTALPPGEYISEGFNGYYGCTWNELGMPVPIATISLNAELIFLKSNIDDSDESKRQTFTTLLHEAIHAYVGTRCGWMNEYMQTGSLNGHGEHFDRLCRAINRRTMEDLGLEVS
ncbi:hypothetical protein MMC30_003210 [Trapelia coarctata]|nr:hypothetical protein [Trapelia coarctata]